MLAIAFGCSLALLPLAACIIALDVLYQFFVVAIVNIHKCLYVCPHKLTSLPLTNQYKYKYAYIQNFYSYMSAIAS